MKNAEDQIVAWLAGHTPLPEELCPIGIGDDMAQVRWNRSDSVCITTDILLEGVHFELASATLEQIGYKAMAVSLSDCAAMATIPRVAVVSLGLPADYGMEEIEELHVGFQRAAIPFDCLLVGGDTTCWRHGSGLLTVNVTMLSEAPPGRQPVRRCGAQEGDVIAVTGGLGASRSGHHLTFTPRVREALTLIQHTEIHAMMDLSDGLSSDLNRLCKASKVGATIQAAQIPLSSAARTTADPLMSALHDGEDFELLFTLAPAALSSLQASWAEAVGITVIGSIQTGSGVSLSDEHGNCEPLPPGGYDHFSD